MDISKDYHGTQPVEELSSREVGHTMQEVDSITSFTFVNGVDSLLIIHNIHTR